MSTPYAVRVLRRARDYLFNGATVLWTKGSYERGSMRCINAVLAEADAAVGSSDSDHGGQTVALDDLNRRELKPSGEEVKKAIAVAIYESYPGRISLIAHDFEEETGKGFDVNDLAPDDLHSLLVQFNDHELTDFADMQEVTLKAEGILWANDLQRRYGPKQGEELVTLLP